MKEKNTENLEMEKLTAQVAELTADLQRTRADFENYRKQVEAQKTNAMQAATEMTVVKMLPLIDDIDRAIATYDELEPLKKSLEKTLKELNLVKIPSENGMEFNPDLHDAVMVEGEGEKEAIAETLRAGYYYNNSVIRPAMVRIARA